MTDEIQRPREVHVPLVLSHPNTELLIALMIGSLHDQLRTWIATANLEPIIESAVDVTSDVLEELDRLLTGEITIAEAPTLATLIACTQSEGQAVEHRCRVCGCTDSNACVVDGQACHWIETSPDGSGLCSACKER